MMCCAIYFAVFNKCDRLAKKLLPRNCFPSGWHRCSNPNCNARFSKKKIASCISFPVPAYCMYTPYRPTSFPRVRHQSTKPNVTTRLLATAQRTRPRAVVGAPHRAAWQLKSALRHSNSAAPRTKIFLHFFYNYCW